MKRFLYIIVALTIAVSFTSCKGSGNQQTEDPNSKAAQSQWDFHLIGSWLYTQEDTTQAYYKGVETFHGTGEYINHTEDAQGNRNVLTGTWRVNNDKEYTIDITIESIKTPTEEKKVDEKHQYTIVALEPGAMLSYVVDGITRTAACVE